jgi:7,8-dihydropterin-6-yl-methyl-4-(beta-D-ribofuranosyl)aminobenzene 5'-phosphate synthase
MIAAMRIRTGLLLCPFFIIASIGDASQPAAPFPQRITIVYDAFGASAGLQKDWGFAAFVEYGGRRILFDTGNDARIFEQNVDRLGIDLSRLDAAIISHRHGDHTTGLTPLLQRNARVPVYVPQEGAMFGSVAPRSFIERYEGELPAHLRYFDGREPGRWDAGTPWPGADFRTVTRPQEIFPGIFVLTTRSQKPGTMEMNEVSLAIRTPQGLVVVVGCSHPGVEKILEQAATIHPRLYTVIGGFHLVQTPRAEVERVAGLLDDTLKLRRVAPGHCTSELGFRVFLDRFKDRFDHAGVGAVLALP